jgi:hypothetical protein
MNNNITDITQLSLVQLESLAYRQLVELDRIQNNIKVIQTEIERKQNEPSVNPELATVEPLITKETLENPVRRERTKEHKNGSQQKK